MNIQELKIQNYILFFANKSKERTITRLMLMKLLWLGDKIHLNKHGRLIINDRYKALPNGPCASRALKMSYESVEDKYSVSDRYIKALEQYDSDFFSKSDIEVMNYVWNKFGGETAWDLRNFSHQFPEWKRFEEEILNKQLPYSYDMVIQDFFLSANLGEFSDIVNEEIIKNSKEHFNVHCAIQSAIRN